MLSRDDELVMWHELREDVISLLNAIGDKRREIQDSLFEATPLDRPEMLAGDVLDYVDGHIQELDEGYSERKALGLYRKNARMAREYGINYIPFQGMNTEKVPEILSFIRSKGLASMNYEQTCKAKEEYYKQEQRQKWATVC